jgi:hypothetical protein
MATSNTKQWKVEATGTENGKSVIWLRCEDGGLIVAPTSVFIMAKLAAEGVHVRNTMERSGHTGRA